ncbi:MAG: ATP-dependent helicase RecG [Campylobacterota bacterium]|nr:ATP-dependent helicase RecG [Campylobacterota bacterium]
MNIEKDDAQKFKKLGIKDILSLALLIPSDYENNFLSDKLFVGEENTIEAVISNIQFSPKQMKVSIYSKNTDDYLAAIYFHPKIFYKNMFVVNQSYYLRGKITTFGALLQIIQPKIIKEVNLINPIYKTPLRNETIKALMQKYLTHKSLKESGLNEKHIKNILDIHFPNQSSFHIIYKNREFSKEHIKTIKFLEIFRYLQKLSSKKTYLSAIFSEGRKPDGFIKNLPFELTNDQKKVINEIYSDLNSPKQARRVVIGDVGCGKTIVILATAFMAYPNKSILMAPTTILANQLFEEAKKFLPQDFRIALHTQKSTLSADEIKNADFIIGTHALLFTNLPEVAVVMIDEQHRFGTKQRHELSLKTMENRDKFPHIFQFSATPIPRTQAMIESAIIDVSIIKEIPFKKDIQTKIINKSDFKNLLEHIKNEIEKNHQVLIVYPLVEASENIDYQSIDEAKEFWQSRFEGVYVTHGKDKEKEKILIDFREKGTILLATTVVEVGISLPRLTTVVISAAERLGMATLHQLKGRVGRIGLKSYCFLYTNTEKNERLNSFIKTKDGFEVAELDLKLRKSGDLLDGIAQSGEHFEWFDIREDAEILKEARGLA